MAVKPAGRPKKDQSASEQQPDVTGTDTNFDPLEPMNFEGEEEEEQDDAPVATREEAEKLMPMSEVMELLRQQEEKNRKMIEDALKNQQPQIVQVMQPGTAIDVKQNYVTNLIDDQLDEPKVFFSYNSDFFIHGDFRNGREVLPPTGPVRFKTVLRTRKQGQNGRGPQIVSVSSTKIESKSQYKFMTEHSMFGILFHEDMNQSKHVDSAWAVKLVEANASIARLNDSQIIARCQDKGIKLTQNVQEMRRKLVETIAKEGLTQDEVLAARTRQAISGYDEIEIAGDRSVRQIVKRTVE